MIPKAPRKDNRAAIPNGNLDGEFQYSVRYFEKEFLRNIKCSVRTIPEKALDQ